MYMNNNDTEGRYPQVNGDESGWDRLEISDCAHNILVYQKSNGHISRSSEMAKTFLPCKARLKGQL